jgi:anaerobic ribonucleoside-triphosphate reductase activating protein
MFISSIQHSRRQEGPGPRTVVWVSGCTIRCPGCINPHLWERDEGLWLSVDDLLARLEPGRLAGDVGVTVVGGEPMEQPDLGPVCQAIAEHWSETPGYPRLIVYTGYTLGQLSLSPSILEALGAIDILVDGPFVRELAAPDLGYRGSSNQRVWNLAAARQGRSVSLDADWDSPRITIDVAGTVMPPTLARQAGLRSTGRIKHCGQERQR